MKPNTAEALRQGVQDAYTAAALEPEAEHPFPVGPEFAASIGYPAPVLERIPREAQASFAGVGNVSCFAEISAGDRVLDIGCGSGLDSMIAAERTGAEGLVLGVDFSQAMLERARNAASHLSDTVHFLRASADALPLPASSVDSILVNGIFNLNPFRQPLFRELARVLRPGGCIAGAELILKEALPEQPDPSPTQWFS